MAKLSIYMKTPDCVDDSIQRYLDEHYPELEPEDRLDLAEQLATKAQQFFAYGEQAEIVIDTEAGTAEVTRQI